MPGEARYGSVFRLCVHLQNTPWDGHKVIGIRWARILDRYQTPVEGTFSVVANGHNSGADTASSSGAVTARRRQSRCGGSTGVAAPEQLKEILQEGLAF